MKNGTSGDHASSVFRSFLFLLGKHRTEYVLVAIAASLVCGVEGVLHPLLIKAIFDEAANRGNFSHFVGLIVGYFVLGLVINVAGYWLSLWQFKVDNKVVRQISGQLLKAYYSKDYKDVLREGHGYYVSRVRSDVKDGIVPILALIRTMAMKFSTLVALMSVLVFISWKAFLILSALIPVSTFVSIVVGKKIRELTSIERDQEAGILASLTKSIGAFKMVKNFNLVPKTLASYESKMDGVLTSGYRKYRVIRLLQGATDLTMVTSDFFSLLVGAIFVFRRQMTFGSYLAFMNSFWRSATTLMQIFREWADLHSQGETLRRVVAFTVHGAASPYHRQGDSVSLENVTYAYGTTEVISGFSLALSSGERALVVGRNGSGKTTLANILSGYLAPSSGNVVLPERISSVTLPIAFPPIRTAELGVDPVYLEMFGLASPGIMGSTADDLSAGQQQKLALALALSQDADLYILDEPLANLDVESRSVAMRAIFERTRGRTLIVIMHGAEEYRGAFHKVIPLGEATFEMSLAS